MNRDARKQFKDEIEATEKKVQEMQLQKLMGKIKILNEKISDFQKQIEEQEKINNILLRKYESFLCAGYMYCASEQNDLTEHKNKRIFLCLGLNGLSLFQNPYDEDPFRVINRDMISDILEINDEQNKYKSSIIFKLEIKINEDELSNEELFLLPAGDNEAERWDTAFFSLNVKAILMNDCTFLLSNKDLILGMTRAFDDPKKQQDDTKRGCF